MLTTVLPALSLLVGPVIPAAEAAEVTEIAPMMRGDAEVREDSGAERTRLVEQGETVANRNVAAHVVTVGLDFSVGPGVGIWLDVPIYAGESVGFTNAREMIFDPDLDTGTMLGATALSEDPFRNGSGVGGVWLGLHGTPFSQDFERGDKATWLVEFGFRTPDQTNFWTTGESGKRGAGPGASAWRLHTAASTTHRWAEPYLFGTAVLSNTVTVDVVDDTGATVATAMEVTPSDTVDIGAGVEAKVWENVEDGSRVHLDFRGTFGYRSWQDIPSGVYLPTILDASRSVRVTQTESTFIKGTLGAHYRILKYAQVGVTGGVGTVSPYRIEHPYEIATGVGGLTWEVHSYVRFRARDPLFD